MNLRMPRKKVSDYTNSELLWFIKNNDAAYVTLIPEVISEILRRMHEIKPLLDEYDLDNWENTIVP